MLKIFGTAKNMPKINTKTNRIGKNPLEKKMQSLKKRLDPLVYGILITIAIIVCIELLSFLAVTIYYSQVDYSKTINYYAYGENNSWFKDYYNKEYFKMQYQYAPYIDLTSKPFHGKYINVDDDGLRKTWNGCAKPDSLRIFVFGGSTTWGSGARDDYTIPSLLSKKLCDKGYSVNVTNFGESSFESSRELVRFVLELRNNNTPDVVIFYDGVNDIYSALQVGKAGLPQNSQNRQLEFNKRNDFNIIRPILAKSSFFKIFFRLFPINAEFPSVNQTSISQNIADVMINNYALADTLAASQNISLAVFVQPMIYTKNMQTSEELQRVEHDPIMNNVTAQTYALLKSNHKQVIYFLDTSLDKNTTFYIDPFHVNEDANGIIADRMIDVLLKNNLLKH